MCSCCRSRKIPENTENTYISSEDGIVLSNGQLMLPTEAPISSATTFNATTLGTVNSNFDWDALYEDSQQSDSSNDEPKKSVLSFLWSQLRVGMDLTKISLPTYILERRSLLEMYADFFAHPDMFIAIADATNPKERIIAVTRWYLASFHAGRKSDVAKKPYNPILGEVFTCSWSTVNEESSKKPIVSEEKVPKFNTNLISDSNRAFFNNEGSFIPWTYSSPNTLVFFGEQVSHHPPISAFYAEHAGKKISLNAHLWTKSKFLGLSVAVYNVGEATVCVQTGSGTTEEYTLGFPSGFARSILSIPWIELGGQVTIICPQTGYNSEVEFCTKGMFGGNRNRVIAKLFTPSDQKKPFLVIDGYWNDVMTSQKPDGKSDRFIDVKSLKIWNKETRRVVEQEIFESRRLWKDVTKALKSNDVDAASNAKLYLENRQRAESKEREENKNNWRPRMFEKRGDGWVFIQTLDKRV